MAQIKIKWRNKYTFCNSLQTYHTNKNLLASITSLELSPVTAGWVKLARISNTSTQTQSRRYEQTKQHDSMMLLQFLANTFTDKSCYVPRPAVISNYHSQQGNARHNRVLRSTAALPEILTGISPSRRYLQLHWLPFFFFLLSSRCMPERSHHRVSSILSFFELHL